MKPPCLRGNEGRAPTFELYFGIRLTTEENHEKFSFFDRAALGAATDCNLQHSWLGLHMDLVYGYLLYALLGEVSLLLSSVSRMTFRLRLSK